MRHFQPPAISCGCTDGFIMDLVTNTKAGIPMTQFICPKTLQRMEWFEIIIAESCGLDHTREPTYLRTTNEDQINLRWKDAKWQSVVAY